MRLIDADQVKHYVMTEGICCDTSADKEYVAEELLPMFPTVDAIPVDWIVDWFWKTSDVCCDLHVSNLFGKMIKDWREENEQREDS